MTTAARVAAMTIKMTAVAMTTMTTSMMALAVAVVVDINMGIIKIW